MFGSLFVISVYKYTAASYVTHPNLPLTPLKLLCHGIFSPGTEGRPDVKSVTCLLTFPYTCRVLMRILTTIRRLRIWKSCWRVEWWASAIFTTRSDTSGSILYLSEMRKPWGHESASTFCCDYLLGYDYDVTAGTFGTSCNFWIADGVRRGGCRPFGGCGSRRY